jgi:hypothetical protein
VSAYGEFIENRSPSISSQAPTLNGQNLELASRHYPEDNFRACQNNDEIGSIPNSFFQIYGRP